MLFADGRYDATTPQRNHVLSLLNTAVALYLALALYIICLYGAWISSLGLVSFASRSASPSPSHGLHPLATPPPPPPVLACVVAAIKFPVEVEKAWLLASILGFALDVVVYHTFSLFVRSVMKLLVGAVFRGLRCSCLGPGGPQPE